MKTSQEKKEDLLKEFMNPEGIRKAPEGFTSRVMDRIHMETVPVSVDEGTGRLKLVPVISVSVIILLVATALLLPGKSVASASGPVSDLIGKIYLHLPSISISSYIKLSTPETLVYISVAVFMLTFFDRVLNLLFHRDQ
jgi:hypothetical protein